MALQVHVQHRDVHALTDLHHCGGVLHIAVGKFAYMHKPVLVHADVHESAESGHVGDDAGQFLAWLQLLHLLRLAEDESLELFARVAAGLGKLRYDILQRRLAHGVGDVFGDVYLGAQARVLYKVAHRGAQVGSHLLHYGISFGVHGAGIQRVPPLAYAQETGGLLESLGPEARHFLQFDARRESPVGVAVIHYVLGESGVKAGNIGKQFAAGGVNFHAHAVDAALHGGVQAFLEAALVHVVLVLAHAYGFRVYLHQLGQRVHKAAAY